MDNGTSSEKLNKGIGTNVSQHCRAGQQSQQGQHDQQGAGYITIADQLQRFSEIGRLPIQLDLVMMRVLRQL